MSAQPLKKIFLPFLALFTLVSLQAHGGSQAIEVQRVNFNSISAGQRGNWVEVEIQLNVLGSPNPEAPNPQFASNIELELYLCYEVRGREGETRRVYYQSEVEIVALERGTRQDRVRFYLPPEIVKRDRISAGRDPLAYSIEIRADDMEIPQTRRSTNLESLESVQNFLGEARSAARGNDGFLQPIYFTPFWNDRRADDAPPYNRDER